MEELESRISQLIIDTLNLEDIEVHEIDPTEPLFGDGLGLDSIDALELALAISQNYGVQIKADDAENKNIFASLSALSNFIEANKVS